MPSIDVDRTPPRVILWDVMGTLVHDPFYVEVPAFFGTSLEALIAAKHPTSWVEFELGHRDEAEMLANFFADGREFDKAGLRRLMLESYRWLPGVERIIASLAGQRVPMHALSNYPDWYQMIEQRLQLSRYLEWSCVSCNMGVRKPDHDIYLRAAQVAGVPADECVFVDDRQVNTDAAREVGMHAVEFHDAAQLSVALADLGFSP